MTAKQPSVTIANSPNSAQLEAIFNILDKVFIVGGDYFRERLLQDSSYQPETTWYASVDDIIASTIQIFPLALRVGNTTLNVGGIGSVGTDPNYQGMGLAKNILHNQCEWMKENDYDLAMLFAVIHPYYEKLGWRLIPETAYLIEKPADQAPSSPYEVIPFAMEYIEQLQAIHEQYNASRTYTLVRNASYWHDLVKWPEWNKTDCLLLRKGNSIVAYGLIEKSSTDRAMLYELNYLPEAEHEVISLFTALCSLRPNCTHIQAKLNTDHKLCSYVQSLAATEVPMNYTMWKLLNVNSLVTKLRSEFEARLADSSLHDKQLHIELHIGEQSVSMNYCKNILTILNKAIPQPTDETFHMTFTPEDFISNILFGCKSDSLPTSVSATEQALHAILFPQQHAIFYTTDKF